MAHHFGARFVAAVRGLSALMQQFSAQDYAIGPVADALTYADQTTGPDGRRMAVEDRFTDMLNRHGPNSPRRGFSHDAPRSSSPQSIAPNSGCSPPASALKRTAAHAAMS
jgi:hypothetical protein